MNISSLYIYAKCCFQKHNYPANNCFGEDVLKTSRRLLLSLPSEGVFKTSSKHLDQDKCLRRLIKTNILALVISLQYVFKGL